MHSLLLVAESKAISCIAAQCIYIYICIYIFRYFLTEQFHGTFSYIYIYYVGVVKVLIGWHICMLMWYVKGEDLCHQHHGHRNVHVQQQTVTPTMHHRTPQEILSSCCNQTLHLIYLMQRDGQLRHGALRSLQPPVHLLLHCLISLFLSGLLSLSWLQSLQLSDLAHNGT